MDPAEIQALSQLARDIVEEASQCASDRSQVISLEITRGDFAFKITVADHENWPD